MIEPESLASKPIGNDGSSGSGGATAAEDKCNQVASMSPRLGRLVVSLTLHDFSEKASRRR